MTCSESRVKTFLLGNAKEASCGADLKVANNDSTVVKWGVFEEYVLNKLV